MSFKEFKAKAKKFIEEHVEEIILGGMFAGGAILGGMIMYDVGRNTEIKRIENWKTGMGEFAGRALETYATTVLPEPEEDEAENTWDEQDYENWNAVCKLASRLKLKTGESYYIQESAGAHNDCGILVNDNSVAHYSFDDETYPPDADAYMEMDWEDEDKEQDQENYLKVKIPKSADEDVRGLVRDFINLIENGDVQITHF